MHQLGERAASLKKHFMPWRKAEAMLLATQVSVSPSLGRGRAGWQVLFLDRQWLHTMRRARDIDREAAQRQLLLDAETGRLKPGGSAQLA